MAKFSLKRFLPMVAGIGVIAASASTVVSCTAPQFAAGEDHQRVVVATDGGNVNDHSFNEDAYLGVKNFAADAYTQTKTIVDKAGNTKEVTERLDGSNDYVEAGGTDTQSIISGYRLAVLKKANAIVTPGFSHVNTLPSAMPMLRKHGVNVILVDGIVNDPNVVSLQFNSQISGVMAGFDTSYLFGTTRDDNGKLKYDTNNDGRIKIGTFAGASNKYGVDNYMWGLLLGMQIYNDVAEQHNKDDSAHPWVLAETANNTKGNTGADGKIQDIQSIGDADPNFYSNSFALGDATKAGIPSKLISNGADVIFPVAGPQIQDVLGTSPANGARAPYVIGVDVDQSAAFPDDGDRFVTSAIKNIDTAVPEALYRASNDKDKDSNTLHDFGTIAEGQKYGNFDTNDHWLGKSPEPFVNWSIDFTNSNAPQKGKYLLQQNYIRLYDEKNPMTTATKAMADINAHFAALGTHSADYMNGNDIFAFAKQLIDHYSPAWTGDNKNVLDFFSSSAEPIYPPKDGDK